jgi:uncharacterized membrane protein YcaP (DUF421 family)
MFNVLVNQLQAIVNTIDQALGSGSNDAVWQVFLKAIIIYLVTLVMVRVGEKRFMGRSTACDVVLGVILGSVVSRAINGSAKVVETVIAGFTLVFAHSIIAELTFRSERLGNLVKGHSRRLAKDGEIDWAKMHTSHIASSDLVGALRLHAHTEKVENVDEVHLERNGDISTTIKPKVLEVKVENGVQTVRIVVK